MCLISSELKILELGSVEYYRGKYIHSLVIFFYVHIILNQSIDLLLCFMDRAHLFVHFLALLIL